MLSIWIKFLKNYLNNKLSLHKRFKIKTYFKKEEILNLANIHAKADKLSKSTDR